VSPTRLIAVATAAVAALAATGLAVGAGNATPSSFTLIGVDLPKSEVYLDNGRKGESAGDMVLFTQRIHRGSRSGPVVGRMEVICTAFSVRGSHCSGTIFLPNGTLTAAGALTFSTPVSRIPILGGTKGYAGARGELRFADVGDTAARYVVLLS
jgi:hypothetical protein